MVLPEDACNHLNNHLRVMLSKRAEHYSPVARMQHRMVEATIAQLIEYPEKLSEGDPDRVIVAVLHKVALGLLHPTGSAATVLHDQLEAAE